MQLKEPSQNEWHGIEKRRVNLPLSLSAHSQPEWLDMMLPEAGRSASRGSSHLTRRLFVAGASIAPSFLPVAAEAAPPPGVDSRRVAGIGGGIDVLTSTPPVAADVIFPSSMLGRWQCQRIIASVEGDAGQAEVAWLAMGGRSEDVFAKKQLETFTTRFIEAPPGIPNAYTFEGKTLGGVVLDRGFEIQERARSPAPPAWDASRPNILKYERRVGDKGTSGMTELTVIQRSIELPSEKGFGSNEFIRITTPASLLGASASLDRAVRVQRRFRRGFDKDGGRIVEGLEIVKTYRVLDGIAGAEMPTSTTKTQIRLSESRPGRA